MEIDCAMLSIPRPDEQYVHRTLESFKNESRHANLDVSIFLGSEEAEYLSAYRYDPKIKIVPLQAIDIDRMQAQELTGFDRKNYNLIVNYYRALSSSHSKADLLVMEDDIVFTFDFWNKTIAAIDEMRSMFGNRWILTLYSTHSVQPHQKESLVAPYPDRAGFYGNQCVILSSVCRTELSSYVFRNGIEKYKEPSDRLLRSYAEENDIPLWQTTPSLVQHIGRTSTGVFTHWHTSPTFNEKSCVKLPKKNGNIAHVFGKIDGWFDFENIYSKVVERASNHSHFVEIGTLFGKSASFMAVEIANSEKCIQFDVIDLWRITEDVKNSGSCFQSIAASIRADGSTYEIFKDNINKYGLSTYIHPIRMNSIDAASLYKDLSLDFVFIDGDHTYAGVRADIAAWLPKIKNGGIIAGHDYDNNSHRSTVLAVDTALPLSQINRDYRSWIFYNEYPNNGHFSVPLLKVKRDFLIYIPYVNRLDLLKKAVQSISSHIQNLIIVDQSDEGLADEWQGRIAIYRWNSERNFTKMQNFLQRFSFLERVPYFMFMHNDAECLNDSVNILLERARMLDDQNQPWGVIFTNYDALCAFSTKAVIKVGAWDESFTWYVSDIDYYQRLKWNGYPHIKCDEAQVVHHVSQTLSSLSNTERSKVDNEHAWAKAHYCHKWGGWVDNETFAVPYGG